VSCSWAWSVFFTPQLQLSQRQPEPSDTEVQRVGLLEPLLQLLQRHVGLLLHPRPQFCFDLRRHPAPAPRPVPRPFHLPGPQLLFADFLRVPMADSEPLG
jgi:hypothetical protein